jgi:hypothetical protein
VTSPVPTGVPISAIGSACCLMRSPKVLLLDEPIRGVDVGTKSETYCILKNLVALFAAASPRRPEAPVPLEPHP